MSLSELVPAAFSHMLLRSMEVGSVLHCICRMRKIGWMIPASHGRVAPRWRPVTTPRPKRSSKYVFVSSQHKMTGTYLLKELFLLCHFGLRSVKFSAEKVASIGCPTHFTLQEMNRLLDCLISPSLDWLFEQSIAGLIVPSIDCLIDWSVDWLMDRLLDRLIDWLVWCDWRLHGSSCFQSRRYGRIFIVCIVYIVCIVCFIQQKAIFTTGCGAKFSYKQILTMRWILIASGRANTMKPVTVYNFFLQSIFLQSIFLQSVFLQSVFLQSIFLQSVFYNQFFYNQFFTINFLQSVFLQSVFLQSIFLQSVFYNQFFYNQFFTINFLQSVFLQSVFLQSVFFQSVFLQSVFLQSVFSILRCFNGPGPVDLRSDLDAGLRRDPRPRLHVKASPAEKTLASSFTFVKKTFVVVKTDPRLACNIFLVTFAQWTRHDVRVQIRSIFSFF